MIDIGEYSASMILLCIAKNYAKNMADIKKKKTFSLHEFPPRFIRIPDYKV